MCDEVKHGFRFDLQTDILHVNPEATASEIKKSYRKLALKFHPDKNPAEGEKVSGVEHFHNVLLKVPVAKI
jgi:curved DNA-binding protein CbpA